MLAKERRALQVFRRVRDFLKDQAPDAALGSVEGLVAQLNEAIEKFESHAWRQEMHRRSLIEATRQQWQQVRALRREFMGPISRGARLLFLSQPSLLPAFRMPSTRDYLGTLAAAQAMGDVATQHAEAFREAGLPEDFVKKMEEAVVALRSALDKRAADVGRRSAATAGLRREYARAREVVRILDAMIGPRLEGTPSRAAEWRTLVRFTRINALPPEAPPVEVTDTPPVAPEEVTRAA